MTTPRRPPREAHEGAFAELLLGADGYPDPILAEMASEAEASINAAIERLRDAGVIWKRPERGMREDLNPSPTTNNTTPMPYGGTPSWLTEGVIRALLVAARSGLGSVKRTPYAALARKTHTKIDTLNSWFERHPILRDEVDYQIEAALDSIEGAVLLAGMTDQRLGLQVLRVRRPELYRQITGIAGSISVGVGPRALLFGADEMVDGEYTELEGNPTGLLSAGESSGEGLADGDDLDSGL